jgi:Biotin/lipoate A/B protein ligase family
MQSRERAAETAAIDLPPPFRLVRLRELGDAFEHAKIIAAERGAGTVVQVGRFDLAEFAVVLEPEEPLRSARPIFYAGMVALREALLAYAPPERSITFTWPDAIHVDGGLIGGGRLGWPPGAVETEPPEWLVFGGSIRTVAMGEKHAALRPLAVALDEEGFDDLGSGRLVESFTRHLMVAVDAWQSGEFATVTRTFLQHLTIEKGAIPSLDGNGDLLVRWRGQEDPDRHVLASALTGATWLDPATGGPRS